MSALPETTRATVEGRPAMQSQTYSNPDAGEIKRMLDSWALDYARGQQ